MSVSSLSSILSTNRGIPIAIEAVDVKSRNRIGVPKLIRTKLGWLRSTADRGLLIMADEPGRIRIIWKEAPAAKEVLRIYQSVTENAEQEDGAVETILRLEDRYALCSFEETEGSMRLTLNSQVVMHLFPAARPLNKIYVVARADDLELWSPEYRNQFRIEPHGTLNDLP